MHMEVNETIRLSNGVIMPMVQLGTWQVTDPDEVHTAFTSAMNAGYRAIDTAQEYGNEELLGEEIRKSSIRRRDIFITSKVWNRYQGTEAPFAGFEISRKALGLEYIDLFLMHWPMKDKYIDTWKCLTEIYKRGWLRSVGVSNCGIYHIQDCYTATGLMPHVNQVELHPYNTHKPLLKFCQERGIQVVAYCPLMHGKLDDPVLLDLAQKYGKSPAQIVLRWHLQNGVAVAPKSVREARIIENIDVFNFEIKPEDMLRIDGMNRDYHFLPNPEVDPFD